MALDPATLVGTPRNWLETHVRYEGAARAEFSNPPGVIEGPGIVCFNADGACRVSITVERIDAADLANFTVRPGGTLGMYMVHGETNPCTSLTVKTTAGVFTSGDRIMHDGPVVGEGKQVEMRPLQSRFEMSNAAPAKYWVLPLANFMPEPWNGHVIEQLSNHPLRILSPPIIPDDVPEDERTWARWFVFHQTSIFTFLLNGELGFIERLPDYSKRVKLVRRRRSRRITAVMVGPAHVQTVEWSDFQGLFPLDILSMLSLAMGTPVGAPWIEFRDEKGMLARRVHICFGAGRYEEARAALLDPFLGNGPGHLVGKILAAPHRGENYLRVGINHALAAATRGTLESRFISLCRGFETLCRRHGFMNQDLAARLEPTQQTVLKTLLQGVAEKIRAMRTAESDPGRKAALDRIADRAQSAGQTEKSFGLAVADLAKMFGFPDEQVLDAHLSAHPHPTGKTWPGILTHYRAAATHDAYFDLAQREDRYTVLRVMNHLHDLLLRVLLKTIGYDGPYRPPIPPTTQRPSVDWVKPTTPPGWLGFA